MPLYEYQCLPNRHRFEVRHGMNEDPVETCPECGGPVRRVIHPVGIVFKGSGFYVNDSRKSNPAAKPAETTATAKSGESKPEIKPEAKPDTKSETPAAS
ncbi:MAG TPA: FmdB family zinc ribbon protein [Chloroflexota bacterium]